MPPLLQDLRSAIRRIPQLLREEIWRIGTPGDPDSRGPSAAYAFLRISSIIFKGVSGNKLFSQAAALSYYSLISLGPVLAIAIMISGFVLQRSDPAFVSEILTKAINFVAPPTAEWDRLYETPSAANESAPGEATPRAQPAPEVPETAPAPPEINLNPELVSVIDNIVQSARSGAVGLIGSLFLIVIVIQMITSIEKSFNDIWGVRRGRSWAQRIVSYWTIISLGAVLTFASLTLLSASTIIRFIETLPFGLDGQKLMLWLGPILSLLLLSFLLAFFNRFFPNTFVRWKPALIGGTLAALLLIGNHYLSFLYVHRVINQQSLYGSVGIIPVLMLGLYMFWLFVLLGGQVTYAVQNAASLTNEAAWENISTRSREQLALAATILICRRFQECQQAPSAGELSSTLRVPIQILNACLTQLNDLGWVSAIESKRPGEEGETRFQPGRPLGSMTLQDFHNGFDDYGNNDGVRLIDGIDPIVNQYPLLLEDSTQRQTPFDRLLASHPAQLTGSG